MTAFRNLLCSSPSFAASVLLAVAALSASAQVPQTTPSPAPAAAPAQQQPASQEPATDGPITTLKARVLEVNLIFTVTDKHGHFIKDLRQQDFGLLDDRKRPESVIRFTQQTNLPLRVGVMLDTSSSIRRRFQFEQQAASEFFTQVLHRNDRAFVEGFDIQTDMAQGFTNNPALLGVGIDKLRPGGGTALYDALYKTCRDEMLTIREEGSTRKAIVLVSDGDDNYSRALESDAIKMCQRAETIVYAISTNVSLNKDKGDDVLKAIAEATGGTAFYPARIEDVAIGFRNIEEELRSQYSLEYKPSDFKTDGSFRTIYLHAIDPRYVVRARTGYFAPRADQ